MTLDWPLAIVLVTVIFLGVVTATTPAHRRSQLQLAEMKAKHDGRYQTLAADYATLATELRDTQSGMQADIAAIRASVESVEQMMRDVG
jgi:Skp family chaperone for outer membrane proteins